MTKIHHNFIERDKLNPWKEYTCVVCSLGGQNDERNVELDDFDHAVIEYSWINDNGIDLDTRTYISSPDRKSNTVGWSRLDNDEEYLIWGDDNVLTGSEAVLCNFNLMKTAFTENEIKVSLNAFWYRESFDRKFNVSLKTYKNGSMVKNGFTWDNVGGQIVQEFNFKAKADNSQAVADIDGFIAGEIIYTRATNSFTLRKYYLDDIDAPSTQCVAKFLSLTFPKYIFAPEGGSVVMAVNSNVGGQNRSEVYSVNPDSYLMTEEGQVINLLNFIYGVLYPDYEYGSDGYDHFNIRTDDDPFLVELCNVGYREFYIRPEPNYSVSNNHSRLVFTIDNVAYPSLVFTVGRTYDPATEDIGITELLNLAYPEIVNFGIPAVLENYEVDGQQKLHIKIGPALNRFKVYSYNDVGWNWKTVGYKIVSCVQNMDSNYLNETASIHIEPLPAHDPNSIYSDPNAVPGYASISFSPVANKSPADIDLFDVITFSNTTKECVSCNNEIGE